MINYHQGGRTKSKRKMEEMISSDNYTLHSSCFITATQLMINAKFFKTQLEMHNGGTTLVSSNVPYFFMEKEKQYITLIKDREKTVKKYA